MSPTSPKNSGNPAKQASVKQQRAAQREAKLAAYRAKQKREARNRMFAIWGGIGAAVIVVALIVTFVVTQPSSTQAIEGVETFDNGAGHTTDSVDYPQTPPAGGMHNPVWLNCGIYEQAVPNENAVHALEHGAVWVTYSPELSDDDVAALREQLPDTYVVMSPFDEMDTPIALSAWNVQLKLDSVDDERIGAFFEKYWRSSDVPEPGASCTGGLDAPGRVA